MFRFLFAFVVVAFCASATYGQKTRVYGVVKDDNSGESLISANVLIADGQGVVTDFDGKYSISVANGTYTIQVSYIGYESTTR